MPPTLDDPNPFKRRLIRDPQEPAVPEVVADEAVFAARHVGVTSELDRFQPATVDSSIALTPLIVFVTLVLETGNVVRMEGNVRLVDPEDLAPMNAILTHPYATVGPVRSRCVQMGVEGGVRRDLLAKVNPRGVPVRAHEEVHPANAHLNPLAYAEGSVEDLTTRGRDILPPERGKVLHAYAWNAMEGGDGGRGPGLQGGRDIPTAVSGADVNEAASYATVVVIGQWHRDLSLKALLPVAIFALCELAPTAPL
jgi:hypothetical protein